MKGHHDTLHCNIIHYNSIHCNSMKGCDDTIIKYVIKTCFCRWGVSACGLSNGPLTMTSSNCLVVIDIHRACCSELASTVVYIDMASH